MKTQQMKARLILKGHNAGELSKVSDAKISLMYQKEVLELPQAMVSAIIAVKKMCGDIKTLKLALYSRSSMEKINAMSEEDLQRMLIETLGLDATIEAAKTMKENGLDEGLVHKYENTLSAMRKERGKAIVEGEKFKALEKEAKEDYLKSLSIYELEDAVCYASRDGKDASDMADAVARIL